MIPTPLLRLSPMLLALLSLLGSGTALAQPWDPMGLAISIDGYRVHRFDRAFDLWEGGRDSGGVGLEVGYDLARLGEDTRLALTAAWLSESQETRGPMSSYRPRTEPVASIGGQSESRSLLAGVKVRWWSEGAVQPYLGLAVGGTRSRLEFAHFWPGPFHSTAHGLLARASLGVRLSPDRLTIWQGSGAPLLRLALAAELGALAGTPLAHEGGPDTPVNDGTSPLDHSDAIPAQRVPLGELSPSGLYGHLGAVVLF